MDGQTHELVALFPAPHLRLERRLRQVVDLIDTKFHLVQELHHVDVVLAFDIDRTESFRRQST
jgi:hypothetical protein